MIWHDSKQILENYMPTITKVVSNDKLSSEINYLNNEMNNYDTLSHKLDSYAISDTNAPEDNTIDPTPTTPYSSRTHDLVYHMG